jgi:hypothetical protein
MVWQGVPWMVAGGEHSAEVGRLLAHAATAGGEGIVGAADCRVTESPIPDGNIHITPGAVGALNQSGGGGQQSYLLRNVGDEVKAITPQGSSGSRYDLICVIVEDPQYPGQPDPPSIPNGPYLRTAVYEGVSSTTKRLSQVDANQSGVALARVHMPASTGTVTQGNITDLRELLIPRVVQIKKMLNVASGSLTLAADAVAPGGASWNVDVPEWAKFVQLEAQWSGLLAFDGGADGGTAQGNGRVVLGTITTSNSLWACNAVGPGRVTREQHMAAEELAVPSTLRGTTVALQARLSKTGGANMSVKCEAGTTVIVTATFYEKAGDGLG